MVRVGVYRGHTKDEATGLSLMNFDVLNELEETKNKIQGFQLVSRFNEWKEPMMDNRIYFVNIIPTEKGKPISEFEILDKCKFITQEDGKYLISYRKYSGIDLIEFYERGVAENKANGLPYNDPTHNEAQQYINYCLSQKKGERLHFNTFTKYILEKVFENYGYDNVIKFRTKNELKRWTNNITQKVKNFVKTQDTKFTDWSNIETQYLIDNMDKPGVTEKMIAKALNRTVPSVATKKWKIRNESTSKLTEMKNRAESISDYVKAFRKEKGYNQKEFSKASGISVSVISQLECKKYIGTETPIVEDLLKYIDKESKNLNISDIPTNGEETTPTVEKVEVPTSVATSSKPAPTQSKVSKPEEDTSKRNINTEYLTELLSEMKFMNGQLLNMQSKLNQLVPGESNNTNKRKGMIRFANNKLKELQD